MGNCENGNSMEVSCIENHACNVRLELNPCLSVVVEKQEIPRRSCTRPQWLPK